MNGYTLASGFNGAMGQYPISQILNIDSNINTVLSSTNETYFSNVIDCNTKIDNQGLLRVYHNQTITLPTVLTQWISVVDAIVYLLQEDIQWNTFNVNNDAHFSLIDSELLTTTATATSAYNTGVNNSITLGTLGITVAAMNAVIPTLISSNVLTNVLLFYLPSSTASSIYLPLSGGTITGTLTAPNFITATSFTYKGTELTTTLGNYLLSSTASSTYLPKTGGTLTGGLAITTGTVAVPSVGNFGGTEDRIILVNGATSTYRYSIGINTNTFWNSVPTGAGFSWYINGVQNMTLSTSGVLNVLGNLQENTTNLSSKYLQLSGEL